MAYVHHLALLPVSCAQLNAPQNPCRQEDQMKSPRFWVIFLLLVAVLTTVHLRASVDRVPPSEPLSLLPQSIDQWSSQDIPITQDTLDILGDGRFLNRVYTEPAASGQVL